MALGGIGCTLRIHCSIADGDTALRRIAAAVDPSSRAYSCPVAECESYFARESAAARHVLTKHTQWRAPSDAGIAEHSQTELALYFKRTAKYSRFVLSGCDFRSRIAVSSQQVEEVAPIISEDGELSAGDKRCRPAAAISETALDVKALPRRLLAL